MWIKKWVAPSASGGKPYVVSEDEHGNFGCACRGWTSHYPRRDCKHIQAAKAGELQTLMEYTLSELDSSQPPDPNYDITVLRRGSHRM